MWYKGIRKTVRLIGVISILQNKLKENIEKGIFYDDTKGRKDKEGNDIYPIIVKDLPLYDYENIRFFFYFCEGKPCIQIHFMDDEPGILYLNQDMIFKEEIPKEWNFPERTV